MSKREMRFGYQREKRAFAGGMFPLHIATFMIHDSSSQCSACLGTHSSYKALGDHWVKLIALRMLSYKQIQVSKKWYLLKVRQFEL